LTDISSEMILTVLPLFLKNVLGVSTALIGVIEGVADSTATLTRLPSGWLSDRLRRRKGLTLLGYGLSTISKPFLYLASSWGLVMGVRFADRVGKGVRTAPRDALLADSAPKEARGRSFGFHRAMDTAGAMVGILGAALIVFLMQRGGVNLERNTFRTIVLVGTVPAVIALIVLWRFVREARAPERGAKQADSAPSEGARFPTAFKVFLAIALLFTLANSSDAFLILRAQDLGLSVLQILLVLAGFNLVYAALSTHAGILSDRIGRRALILGGWVAYALIYLGFAVAGAAWQVVFLFLAYGLYYAAAEGTARSLVADLAPSSRRGAAYGIYHTAMGITAFPASLLAGWLWQAYSPRAPFLFSAAMAGLAALLLTMFLRVRPIIGHDHN
ncbi:MAG: MFS transporter, partial [Chloroflexota bacterium]|nr:MFS transporter [Chloroflexota bacterium]